MRKLSIFLMSIMLLPIAFVAQTQDLQDQLKDFEVGEQWIYNDLQAAIDRAKSEGKPLFVLFR